MQRLRKKLRTLELLKGGEERIVWGQQLWRCGWALRPDDAPRTGVGNHGYGGQVRMYKLRSKSKKMDISSPEREVFLSV